MSNPNLPAPHEESDRFCEFIHPEGHAKAGRRCEANHTTTSPFCTIHGEGIAKLADARKRQAQKKRDLVELLRDEYHQLRSPEAVLDFIEKIANAVSFGVLKKDEGSQLTNMAMSAYKIIRDNKMGQRATMTLIQESGDSKLIAQFSSDEIDQFLLGNDVASVELLDTFRDKGLLRLEKRKDKDEQPVIDITPEPVVIPVKPKPVVNLFAKSEPQPMLHDWQAENERTTLAGMDVLQQWFVCQGCGRRVPSKTKDECPNPRKEQ